MAWDLPTRAVVLGGRRTGGSNNELAQGEQKYFQTLAKIKLGNREGSEASFNELITTAAAVLNQTSATDADMPQVSRRQTARPNAAVAHYNAGLGYAGLGDKKNAVREFNAALELSPDYLNPKIALDQL